jgi:putative transposase
MAWSETTQMSRFRFVGDFESCLYEMTELCEKYGISRKTGYKWAERYGSEGAEGLKDRSRAPKRRPTQTPTEVTQRLVQLRRQHPTWGPRKLLAWLEKHEGERAWPAASTVGGILKREGLVLPSRRQRRDRPPSSARMRTEATEANRVWTGDYKGAVPHRGWSAVLPVDPGGFVQPLRTGHPRLCLGGGRSGLACL